MPDLNEEYEEIAERGSDLNLPVNQLLTALQNGKLELLDDTTWKQLQNTDSWRITTLNSAKIKAQEYGKDINSIIKGFYDGQIPAPMIIKRAGQLPYLIGGNTRLMAARALKIRPKVLIANLPSIKIRELSPEEIKFRKDAEELRQKVLKRDSSLETQTRLKPTAVQLRKMKND